MCAEEANDDMAEVDEAGKVGVVLIEGGARLGRPERLAKPDETTLNGNCWLDMLLTIPDRPLSPADGGAEESGAEVVVVVVAVVEPVTLPVGGSSSGST